MKSEQKLIDFLDGNDISGDCVQIKGFSSNKNEFKKLSRSFFKEFLKENNWTGDIRFCAGGQAVSGEAILHCDKFYIVIFPDKILYRSCISLKDYCGGPNNFLKIESLGQLTEKIKKLIS